MTLTAARTYIGALGSAAATRVMASGEVSMFGGVVAESFPSANAMRACTVVLTYASAAQQAVGYVVATGACTAATGSPTITDSAVDFEGRTAGTITKCHWLRIERTDSNAGAVTVAAETGAWAIELGPSAEIVIRSTDGNCCDLVGDILVITYHGSTDSPVTQTVRISALGQTA